MDELKRLQLKANDGKAYQFTTANNNSKQVSSRFETLQLARLHIDKFARLRPQQGADLLAVLGMLDFPAEVQARSGGRRSFVNAREILAKALFDGKLRYMKFRPSSPLLYINCRLLKKESKRQNKLRHKGERKKNGLSEKIVLAMPQ